MELYWSHMELYWWNYTDRIWNYTDGTILIYTEFPSPQHKKYKFYEEYLDFWNESESIARY